MRTYPSFALLALLTATACGSSPSPRDECRGCPQARGTPRLVGGSVTQSVAGGATQTLEVFDRRSADATHCAVSSGPTDVKDTGAPTTGDVWIACRSGAGGYSFRITGLGDPRAFAVGTHPLKLEQIVGTVCVPTAGASTCAECAIRLTSEVKATLVVEAAVGGVAPYPTLVTADYRRSYRIELETGLLGSSATATTGAGVCASVRTKVTVRFEETAADWRFDPNGPCPCDL